MCRQCFVSSKSFALQRLVLHAKSPLRSTHVRESCPTAGRCRSVCMCMCDSFRLIHETRFFQSDIQNPTAIVINLWHAGSQGKCKLGPSDNHCRTVCSAMAPKAPRRHAAQPKAKAKAAPKPKAAAPRHRPQAQPRVRRRPAAAVASETRMVVAPTPLHDLPDRYTMFPAWQSRPFGYGSVPAMVQRLQPPVDPLRVPDALVTPMCYHIWLLPPVGATIDDLEFINTTWGRTVRFTLAVGNTNRRHGNAAGAMPASSGAGPVPPPRRRRRLTVHPHPQSNDPNDPFPHLR